MNNILVYLLKASVFLAFSHLFFRLFFYRTIDFRLRRIFLLATVIISLILPLISFRVTNNLNFSFFTIALEPVIRKASPAPEIKQASLSLQQIVLIIYIIGATVLFIRFFLKLFQLWLLYIRNEKEHLQGFTLVKLKKELSPFTFFHVLFVPHNMGENKNADALKTHEMSHARELHSLDLICFELTGILLWFHPSVWQLKKQCLLNHEYLADASVMKKGYAMSDYRFALVDAAIRFHGVVLGNSFNQSEIIKRLKMLLSENYSSKQKRGVFYMFSFIAVVTGLFFIVNACDQSGSNVFDLPVSTDPTAIVQKADIMPTFQGKEFIPAIRSYIANNLKYPDIATQNQVESKVFVQFVVDAEGKIQHTVIMRNNPESVKKDLSADDLRSAGDALSAESLRVINSMSGITPAVKDGKRVSTQYTIPIVYRLK